MERENIASKFIYPEVRFFRRTRDSSFIKSITVDITVIFLSDEFSSFLRITRWYVSQGDPYAMVILHRAEARRFHCVSLCMADVSRFGIFWLCNNSDGQWFRYRWCLMIHQRYLNHFPYIFTNHVWWFLMETLWFFIATLNIQRLFEYANIIKRIKPPYQSFPRSRIIYMKPHRKIHESYSTVYQNGEPLESHGTWRTYEITNLYIYTYIYITHMKYTPVKHIQYHICVWLLIYTYIYTLGALGFRRVSWFSLIHMSKIIVSPQRNVDFAHSSFSFFNDNVTELNF